MRSMLVCTIPSSSTPGEVGAHRVAGEWIESNACGYFSENWIDAQIVIVCMSSCAETETWDEARFHLENISIRKREIGNCSKGIYTECSWNMCIMLMDPIVSGHKQTRTHTHTCISQTWHSNTNTPDTEMHRYTNRPESVRLFDFNTIDSESIGIFIYKICQNV